MQKRIAILGSTGSIGSSALEVIEHLGSPYRAVALSAHRQTQKLLEQIRRHQPAAVAITDEQACHRVRQHVPKHTHVYCGAQGLLELVRRDDVDLVLVAIVGSAGLPAVLAAVQAGKQLALANKEALVLAGSVLIPAARRSGVKILPVDSEHSAVFQAMHCGRLDEVARVILTASGGPFRNASIQQIEDASLQDALNHPTWRMGNKVTIDSATMFNKALELIEACWLFDLPPEKVQIVIHPESIVHSMVEFIDGSLMAQLSPPDMRTPIQYALTYPRRCQGIGRKLDLAKKLSLHFETPDPQRFPALGIAYDVAKRGGTLGAVMNAANEAAVAAFIAGQIPFGQISRIVQLTISRHNAQSRPSLEDLLQADRWARDTAETLMVQTTARHSA